MIWQEWFKAQGMYLGRAEREGAFYVRCPWAHEHAGATHHKDTVLFEEPGRVATFVCLHSTCRKRHLGDPELEGASST